MDPRTERSPQELFEVFASDVCPQVRAMLLANFSIEKQSLFSDIRTRKQHPKVHIYTAGPPCQSFSKQGKREGTKSENGMILLWVVLYIAQVDCGKGFDCSACTEHVSYP